jgi:hypothetical protein
MLHGRADEERAVRASEVWFALDLVEEDGFEPSVPPRREWLWGTIQASIAVSNL